MFAPVFCSLILNWFDMMEQAPGKICCTSLFQEQAPSCVLKFACRAKLGSKSFVARHTFSLEIVGADEGALLRKRVAGACCGSTLPRRVLRVHWLGYFPRSVFQEQAPSCVPALINGLLPMHDATHTARAKLSGLP